MTAVESEIHAASESRTFQKSQWYRERAKKHLAFGVSSTARGSQLPAPVVIDRASGVVLVDVDGNNYIDYCLGYGPLILGHSPTAVVSALTEELSLGLRTASVHSNEAKLAELIADCVPCGDQCAFVSSGTEGVQLALRTARAVTGKLKIIKFRANYHGWMDTIQVGGDIRSSGPATIGQDPSAAQSIVLLDWGDSDAFRRTISTEFAAVILEPAAINAGCFAPPNGFLETVRTETKKANVPLIFDEVITGFRLALGGAQSFYGVIPDAAVIGKALGAGLPISALVGSRGFMEPLSSGRLNHRGTFNGNPVSIAAALACLKILKSDQTVYARMSEHASDLRQHIMAYAKECDVDVCANSVGPTVQVFVGAREMSRISDLSAFDLDRTVEFTADLLRCGVYTLPRGLMYISTVHTKAHFAKAKAALSVAIDRVGNLKK